MELVLSFCGDCGSHISKVALTDEYRGTTIIHAGTLDDKTALDKLAPGAELWVKYRVPWMSPVAEAAQMQEFT